MKLYDSREWLFQKHHREHKRIEEIAQICGVNPRTIRRKMEQFKIPIINWRV